MVALWCSCSTNFGVTVTLFLVSMTPIILTPKKVPILHSELTPKNGVTVTLYFLQCSQMSTCHKYSEFLLLGDRQDGRDQNAIYHNVNIPPSNKLSMYINYNSIDKCQTQSPSLG